MAAQIMDGNAVAAEIRTRIAGEVADLAGRGVSPGLGTLLVGDDPGSASYVRGKHRDCQEVGIESVAAELPETATSDEVEAAIDGLNSDPAVSAFIVQLPLPGSLDENDLLARVDPAKDADGLHPFNLGRLVLQSPTVLPCTPNGVCELLERYEVPVDGADVVVIGRGKTVGRPLALLLSMRRKIGNATVTTCHTGTKDLQGHVARADIVVSASGVPGMITGDWIKPGAAVFDIGISRTDQGLVGDVDRESVERVAGWLAPMPGGVGPMTRAMLLSNTVAAAREGH